MDWLAIVDHLPGATRGPDGEPVDAERFGALLERRAAGELHYDDTVGDIRVSTAWFGVDLAMDGSCWETAVFLPEPVVVGRWRTQTEAERKHLLLVDGLRRAS